MSFGSRLKVLRIKHNLTQSELAEKINLSKANVSKYEADLVEPNLDTLKLISSLFSVSIDYLLGNEKATLTEQPASQKLKNLIDSYADLSEDEIDQVTNFVDFLKTKRNF